MVNHPEKSPENPQNFTIRAAAENGFNVRCGTRLGLEAARPRGAAELRVEVGKLELKQNKLDLYWIEIYTYIYMYNII